jgi:hypothetical protein
VYESLILHADECEAGPFTLREEMWISREFESKNVREHFEKRQQNCVGKSKSNTLRYRSGDNIKINLLGTR